MNDYFYSIVLHYRSDVRKFDRREDGVHTTTCKGKEAYHEFVAKTRDRHNDEGALIGIQVIAFNPI